MRGSTIMSGDVFEFSLDDLVEAEEPDLYPALPPREKGGAPSDSIDFEIVNEVGSSLTSWRLCADAFASRFLM